MNRSGMKYTVISFSNLDNFVGEINRYMAEGWRCTGGICLGKYENRYERVVVYYQAMVKEEYVNPTNEDPLRPMGES